MKKLLIGLPLILSACAYDAHSYIPSVNVTPAPRPYYPNNRQQTNYNYQPYIKNSSNNENHGHHEHHDNGNHYGEHKNKNKHHHDDD